MMQYALFDVADTVYDGLLGWSRKQWIRVFKLCSLKGSFIIELCRVHHVVSEYLSHSSGLVSYKTLSQNSDKILIRRKDTNGRVCHVKLAFFNQISFLIAKLVNDTFAYKAGTCSYTMQCNTNRKSHTIYQMTSMTLS